jgi:non-specific serine/threonine protein kinase
MKPSLRAPEIVLSEPFDHKVDIWAFGCVIWYFITGCPMFSNYGAMAGVADKQTQQDDHLLQMYQALGPLPETLLMKWPRRFRYFDTDGTPIRTWLGPSPFPEESEKLPPVGEVLKTVDLPGMGEKEVRQVLEVLRWTLQYDPKDRPSTAELLEHEWFK